MSDLTIDVIIPAAGRSSRFGGQLPGGRSKLDEDLGGRPVLQRTIELFVKRPEVRSIVVAGPGGIDEGEYEEFLAMHGDKLGLMGVTLCRGGETHRYETVAKALEHVGEDATHIAVHDAARPCVSNELIDRVFEASKKHDAVVPGIEVSDTLKRVSAEAEADEDVDPLDAILGEAGKPNTSVRTVEETVSRANLVCVQTPQVFRAELLRRAYAQDDLSSTDDASLIEKLGERVAVVEGDPMNIKITRKSDLHHARLIMKAGGGPGGAGKPAHKRF